MSLPRKSPVLIVDDASLMVEVMTALLRRLGFVDIDAAVDGSSALRMLRAKRYGLVLSDLNMQPMNGLELLREVRTDPDLKPTPFILTTTSLHAASVVAAKRAGVDTYLLKPFTVSQLQRVIGGL